MTETLAGVLLSGVFSESIANEIGLQALACEIEPQVTADLTVHQQSVGIRFAPFIDCLLRVLPRNRIDAGHAVARQ